MDKFKKKYTILSFEADENKKLRLHSLFNLLQDMADHQADKLGFGYDFCRANHMGWVAVAYHLKINRLPNWREEVEIETWPSGATAVCGIRDFRITNQGEELVLATSEWALIDTEKLRPLSIAKHLSHYEPLDERALDSDFSKIQVPDGPVLERTFPVHRDDIDINLHVNNALYPTWCLDTMNDEFLKRHEIDELKIFFKKSAKWGMDVMVRTHQNENETIHEIVSADQMLELAVVKIKWKQISK